MGYMVEDNCVGPCPMGCIHCGKSHEVNLFCDECGAEYQEELFMYEGKELCWECYKERFEQRVCEDDDITECSNCGNTEDILYRVEGEWICEACMMDLAEKVEE